MYKVKDGITIKNNGEIINDRNEVARIICNTANNDCLHIRELWCWEQLADKWCFGENEFIDQTVIDSDEYYNGGYHWNFVPLS